MVTAIVLAGGTSSRMGTVKQLIPFRGKPLICHVLIALAASKADGIIVVLGHRHQEVADLLRGFPVKTVFNPDYQAGQSTSLLAGLRALAEPGGVFPAEGVPYAAETGRHGVLFVLADQPLLQTETINRLLEAFSAVGGIVAPSFGGVRGNPILFDLKFRAEFESLRGDTGAREIIDRYPEALTLVEVSDPGVVLDVDTPDDLARLKQYL